MAKTRAQIVPESQSLVKAASITEEDAKKTHDDLIAQLVKTVGQLQKTVGQQADELRVTKRLALANGGPGRGVFYQSGGCTLACADVLYAAGQGSPADWKDALEALTELRVIHFDSTKHKLPPTPASSASAYILAIKLMSRRRPKPQPHPEVVKLHKRVHKTLHRVTQRRAKESMVVLPLVGPGGWIKTARNVGVHDMSLDHWLAIGEAEVEVANKRGKFPSERTAILHLFKKVFGCTLLDARSVLGDIFINDPAHNLYLQPYVPLVTFSDRGTPAYQDDYDDNAPEFEFDEGVEE